MNTKTMEGLVGAKTNMTNMNVPMCIFKEARRRVTLGQWREQWDLPVILLTKQQVYLN